MNGIVCPKRGYDKKDAATMANHVLKQFGRKVRIYQCPDCNRWHLTHTQKWGGMVKGFPRHINRKMV